MEEIFEIRSCIEILANDIKVNTADEYMTWNPQGYSCRFCNLCKISFPCLNGLR